MANLTRTARRAARAGQKPASEAGDRAKDAGGKARDTAGDTAGNAADQAGDVAGQASGGADQAKGMAERTAKGTRQGGDDQTLVSELQDTIREAAIEVLKPMARTATRSAATYAVTKGPGLLMNRVAPKITEAGGPGAIAKNVAGKGGGLGSSLGNAARGVTEKLGSVGGDDEDSGGGARLPVMESVDVGVDLETAYDQFTQFEDWPEIMQHVNDVEQRDDTTLKFPGGLWGLRRSLEAEIVEQIPFERIVWRGNDETETVVVATFHRLSDNLTRVQISMNFQPQGLLEKTTGTRLARRALRSDLLHFKAYMEMRDEATGSWRGTIEEGEVSETPEDAEESQGEDGEGQEPEASEEEEPEASEDSDEEEEDDYEEEPEASSDEEEEPEASSDEEEEPEASSDEDGEPEASSEDEGEEEPPVPPRRRRAKAASGTKAKAGSGAKAKAGSGSGSPSRSRRR